MPVMTRERAKQAESMAAGTLDDSGKGEEALGKFERCKEACGHFECHPCILNAEDLLPENSEDNSEEEDNGWTRVSQKLLVNSCIALDSPRHTNIKKWSSLIQLEQLRGYKIFVTDPETGWNVVRLECRFCGFIFNESFDDYEKRKSQATRKSHMAMAGTSRSMRNQSTRTVGSACFFCKERFLDRSEFIGHVLRCGGERLEKVSPMQICTPESVPVADNVIQAEEGPVDDGKVAREGGQVGPLLYTPRRRKEDLKKIQKPLFKKQKKMKKEKRVYGVRKADNLGKYAGTFQKRWR